MKHLFKLLCGFFFVGLLTLFGCQIDELQSIMTSNNEGNFVEGKEALEVASSFLEQNSDVAQARTGAGGIPELRIIYIDGEPHAHASDAQRSTYYIINYGDNGYIVVSVSKSTCPILGYSTNDKFNPDKAPVNAHELLGGYPKGIRFAYESIEIGNRIKQVRQTAIVGTSQEMNTQTSINPLLANIH